MTDINLMKVRQLNFTLLLVLQSLLRRRSATQTASELGLSQPAISHALARLRDLFGDELFVRRPHGLEPTRHALELAPMIDGLLQSANDAMGLGDAFDPLAAPRDFRIGALDHVATLLSPPLLGAFERQAPHARFAMRVVRGPDALEALRRNEIDLALGQFQQDLDGFEAEPLFTDHYRLVARADHPQIGKRMTKAGFERLNHVTISVGGDFRTFTDEGFREVGLSRRVVATAPTFAIAFGIVGQSNAIAVTPGRLAARYAATFGLTVHDLPRPLPPIQIVSVRRRGDDRAVAWLIDLVRACAVA
jgi:DNA-binding transcriptional LysR family regulator